MIRTCTVEIDDDPDSQFTRVLEVTYWYTPGESQVGRLIAESPPDGEAWEIECITEDGQQFELLDFSAADQRWIETCVENHIENEKLRASEPQEKE